MVSPLKLLVEEPSEVEYLFEEQNKDEPRQLYIQGLYLMAERKNKNGRVYNIEEMTNEVDRYKREMIGNNRSLGELNHPTSVDINPERACHMIIKLEADGNNFIGRSKILSTPMGQIVRSLIMDDVKLGVSSRALGKLNPAGDHNDVEGFKFIAEDVVHDPSVDSAFVNGILESKEWILNHSGEFEELYNTFEGKLADLPRHDVDEYLTTQILDFIGNLGKK